MYLSRLHISKFRVFDDITLYFKNGINILIGEIIRENRNYRCLTYMSRMR